MDQLDAVLEFIDAGKFEAAEEALQALPPELRLARSVFWARLLARQGKFEEANMAAQLALELAVDVKDPHWQIAARSEWVVPQWELGLFDAMKENIRLAEVIVDSLPKDQKYPILVPLGQLNQYMGKFYLQKGMLETAVRYLRKSFFAYRNGGDETLSALPVSLIGQAYFDEKMYDAALLHHYEALNILEKIGKKEGMLNQWVLACNTHEAMGNFNRAVEVAERCVRYAKDLGLSTLEAGMRERLEGLRQQQYASGR